MKSRAAAALDLSQSWRRAAPVANFSCDAGLANEDQRTKQPFLDRCGHSKTRPLADFDCFGSSGETSSAGKRDRPRGSGPRPTEHVWAGRVDIGALDLGISA